MYDGAATVEPSAAQATILVPASITLHVPRVAHWAGKLVLTGRVRGGYLPPDGETVILSVRFGDHEHDFAHLLVSGNGRFRYVYTFLPGTGTARYPFSAETVRESGYAYTPGQSRSGTVRVTPWSVVVVVLLLSGVAAACGRHRRCRAPRREGDRGRQTASPDIREQTAQPGPGHTIAGREADHRVGGDWHGANGPGVLVSAVDDGVPDGG